MSLYIIDSSWDGEDDVELLDYIEDKMILSSDEILKLEDITQYKCIFTASSNVQKLLGKTSIPSYHRRFTQFYGREIEEMTVQKFNSSDYNKPKFVKPFDNDKSFGAMILPEGCKLLGLDECTKIYVCEKVKFINEFRI